MDGSRNLKQCRLSSGASSQFLLQQFLEHLDLAMTNTDTLFLGVINHPHQYWCFSMLMEPASTIHVAQHCALAPESTKWAIY